jgi:acyl carrier protein
VIVGSEKVYPEQLTVWWKLARNQVRLINAYGSTEATITSAVYEPVSCRENLGLSSVPIGRPIANTRIYILDRFLHPVPVGVPGELHIGGIGLARGYHNHPKLTAEKFIPNPFSNTRNARLFKTGDWARYLSDGNIELLGRIDHQVKIRGFRVEPGEIEAVLSQHPTVQENVVTIHEDVSGDRRLVAYVVTNQHRMASEHELRRFLSERIPDYMVPNAFVSLDALPLTHNGKVDRGALPAPTLSRSGHVGDFVAPRSRAEEVMAAIWADVLGLERVSTYDNFFELGGHSLLATQIISRASEAFEVQLPLRQLFETPTVASLAESISAIIYAGRGRDIPHVQRFSREVSLPLTFAQEDFWDLDQLLPNTHYFNMHIAVRLTGVLDVPVLVRAFGELTQRHEILRTTFVRSDGQPAQAIAPPSPFHLAVIDLQEFSVSEQEIRIAQLDSAHATLPFDLAGGPLLRACLVCLEKEEHILFLTMHHIISDGWSISVIFWDLGKLYEALSTGKPQPLPELPYQYADFAAWQRQTLQGEFVEIERTYWKQALGGKLFPLVLPADYPRSESRTFRYGHQRLVLSSPLVNQLRGAGRREATTPFMILLSVFKVLLYLWTGQEDIRVLTLSANRNHPGSEELVGLFMNTLVLRTDLSGSPTFKEVLQRVRRMSLEAFDHQDLPFKQLVKGFQGIHEGNPKQFFPILFNYQNVPTQVPLAGLAMSDLKIKGRTNEYEILVSTFELIVETEERTEDITILIKFDADLFRSDTIDSMLKYFLSLLEDMLLHPGRHLTEITDYLGHISKR